MFRNLLWAFLSLAVLSCSTVPEVQPGADNVIFVDQAPENCQYLGNIQQVQQSFFQNSGDNVAMESATENSLKNRALGKGGDTLHILPDPTGRLQRSRQYGTSARQYTRTFIVAVYDCKRQS